MSRLVLILIFAPLFAFGGRLVPTEVLTSKVDERQVTESGNGLGIGGDVVDRRRLTAWFYGSKRIRTCFTHSRDFGADRPQVKKSIQNAIRSWQAYFEEKQIANTTSNRSVNTNFHLQKKCVGDEDLRMHFGTGPIFGNMRDLKATMKLDNPVALAHKTHLTEDLLWSKGYIRFVKQGYYLDNKKRQLPDWKKAGSLEVVVLHEIGHVLGFAHVEGTAMSAQVVTEVFREDAPISTSIDQKQTLVKCKNCEKKLTSGQLPKKSYPTVRNLGLDPELPLQLSIRKGRLAFIQGKTKKDIEVVRKQRVSERQTLLSNFSGEANDGIYSIVAFGKLGELSILLNPADEGLHVQISSGSELIDLGRFTEVSQ